MFPWTLRWRYQHGVPDCSGSPLRGPRSVQGRLEEGVAPAVSELEFREEPKPWGRVSSWISRGVQEIS